VNGCGQGSTHTTMRSTQLRERSRFVLFGEGEHGACPEMITGRARGARRWCDSTPSSATPISPDLAERGEWIRKASSLPRDATTTPPRNRTRSQRPPARWPNRLSTARFAARYAPNGGLFGLDSCGIIGYEPEGDSLCAADRSRGRRFDSRSERVSNGAAKICAACRQASRCSVWPDLARGQELDAIARARSASRGAWSLDFSSHCVSRTRHRRGDDFRPDGAQLPLTLLNGLGGMPLAFSGCRAPVGQVLQARGVDLRRQLESNDERVALQGWGLLLRELVACGALARSAGGRLAPPVLAKAGWQWLRRKRPKSVRQLCGARPCAAFEHGLRSHPDELRPAIRRRRLVVASVRGRPSDRGTANDGALQVRECQRVWSRRWARAHRS